MIRDLRIDLQYQPFCDNPPDPTSLFKQACTGDALTIDSWRSIWIENYKKTADRFGDLSPYSLNQLYGINKYKPAICIASGPSLKVSIEALKKNQELETPLLTISALHNLSYMLDEGIHVDYYVTLDSGEIILQDAVDHGKNTPEWYWEKTKDSTLLAIVPSTPKLWDLWKGKMYFFNAPIPDLQIRQAFTEIQPFSSFVSSGGNCGGALMYIAKAFFGSPKIIFVGYDFCFSYDNEFHSYPTQYDNFKGNGVGQVVLWPDVYGIPRKTWPSYLNFKCYLDSVAMRVPGDWVYCSEGLLGAYKEGNIRSYKYCTLDQALQPYLMAESVTVEARDPSGNVTGKNIMKLKELYSNPKTGMDLVLF
jgi:hypothetical protein